MSDYDPRYPGSLSYPPPPGGHYPPGGYYPPPTHAYNPSSPTGSCPYPSAPPHDPSVVVPVPVPVPEHRPLYPQIPQTHYPPPPNSSSSSSSSSSPSSTSSSHHHARSNYAAAKKHPPAYVPPPPGRIYKSPLLDPSYKALPPGPIYKPPLLKPSHRTPPPPYTPNPQPPPTTQNIYHYNIGSYSPNITCHCSHIPTTCCCRSNNPNSRPSPNHHHRGPHNAQQKPRFQHNNSKPSPVQNRTEKVFIRTVKNEGRYSMNIPGFRYQYENVPCQGAGYYWIDWSSDRGVPPTAVHGGTDIDGSQIFVGRAYHEGDWIPAKVIPDKQVAYVAYGGGEHAKHKFQVLCEQRFDWVPSSGGHVPFGAVEGGRTSEGEILYIGRVCHGGAHTVGKIHPSHRCLYIPYDCREMSFPDYEVLVLRT